MSSNVNINIEEGVKAIIKYGDEKKFKVPSHLLPLNGPICVFLDENTDELKDPQIEAVYNAYSPRVGRCYTNTRDLASALLAAGVNGSRIKTYVGWLVLGNGWPIHHSMVVVDDKHVLDYAAYRLLDEIEDSDDYHQTSKDEFLEYLTADMAKTKHIKNSERFIFGKALNISIYLVSECSPEDGMKIRSKLLKAFPKHVCFSEVNRYGHTPSQVQLLQKLR